MTIVLENTLGINRGILEHYRPESVDELIEIYTNLKTRNMDIAVYSRGHNWGYGCKTPAKENMALVGLENLNNIIEFDAYHGIVTLQPGVTYGQLAKYLEENGDKWIAPVHGGGPNCSVIGNALERGYGLTPNTDHFGAVNNLKAILEDGSIYQGALTQLGQERLDKLFKYSIGPYWEGVFTQSGFGIVTEMTIRLAKKAEYMEMFYFSLKDESQISECLEIIKKLKRDLGDNLGGINLINKERMLSMVIDYPQDKIEKGLALTEEEINSYSKKYLITPWLIVGALYGEKEIVKSTKKILKKRLSSIKSRRIFYNSNNRKYFKYIGHLSSKIDGGNINKMVGKFEDAYNILNGKPNSFALNLAYWKHEKKQELLKGDLNPSKDGCGLIWYAPLIEMKSEKVLEYIDFINNASKKFNINSLITLTTVDDLCFDSTIPILFNKENKEDTENAWEYYRYLLSEGAKKGFYPYRLNIEDQVKLKEVKAYNAPFNIKTINSSRY